MASATIQVSIHDYYSAQSALHGRAERKIGNNTYLYQMDGEVWVKYHNTYIAKFSPGLNEYTSGGWQTYTTKDRLNQLLPSGWTLYQKNHEWYLRNYHEQVTIPWESPMCYDIQMETWS